ncbi:MAG: TldD/PmbA family protein [bacterium]
MKDLAELAIDIGQSKGATALEVRIQELTNEEIELRDLVPTNLTSTESCGIGIKVYQENSWGFASTSVLNKNGVEETVMLALEIAKAGAGISHNTSSRVPEPVHVDHWVLPIHQDTFTISVEEKLRLLEKINRTCQNVKGVRSVISNMAFQRRHQYFSNMEGSQIDQVSYLGGVGFVVIASDGNDRQVRSYPNSFGGQFAATGYELVYDWPLLENAERIAEEAVALLRAPECPSRKCDLILDGSQLALQIHETFGHPAELDRVLGYEANFAGTSFLTREQRHNLRYSSDIVNLYADARPAHIIAAGTYAYDDEGVAAQRTDLVKNGIFVNYLFSRDTAAEIGEPRSNGCVRASGWNRVPIIRQTNVCLEPGNWQLEALIADTEDGILMQTNKSWSIDDKRENFQFGTEIAWEIKNGKRTRILKNPTYSGLTTDFWQSCDAICGKDEWVLWGIPNCGKGQPEQLLAISHGASPARFRNIDVGVSRAK